MNESRYAAGFKDVNDLLTTTMSAMYDAVINASVSSRMSIQFDLPKTLNRCQQVVDCRSAHCEGWAIKFQLQKLDCMCVI